MNVLLGADSLLAHRSGVGRMTMEIAQRLRTRPDVDDLRLLIEGRLYPAAQLDQARHFSSRPALSRRLPLRLKLLLAQIPSVRWARKRLIAAKLERECASFRRAGPLVYHEPNMIVYPWTGPTVTTFNDLSWLHHPETHPAERIAWIERGLPRTLRQATRFVTISEFTASGLASEFAIARERIDVVPLAPSELFRPIGAEAAAPALARHGLQDRAYMLAVSTLEPRKNFDRLLAAWLHLPVRDQERYPLAIVGAKGWGQVLASADAERARSAGRLLLLGHVGDEDLAALYSRCAVFVYPSLYEGFGLPVVEAMAAGAPVITSATTACGETAGDAALLVDPRDTTGITACMAGVIGDQGEAERLRRLGLQRAAAFSWTRTVDLLLQTWQRAVAA
ncbi:MAG: glycosyltransferase family 4 protein [Acetobacteraceae bacterium]|nr:glycosyltransferase family 4 protein [Acetobacteraceae bacterium]